MHATMVGGLTLYSSNIGGRGGEEGGRDCTTEKYTNWGSENSLIIHEGRFRMEKDETVRRAGWRLFEYHSEAVYSIWNGQKSV